MDQICRNAIDCCFRACHCFVETLTNQMLEIFHICYSQQLARAARQSALELLAAFRVRSN
jgi:hypothetical protein